MRKGRPPTSKATQDQPSMHLTPSRLPFVFVCFLFTTGVAHPNPSGDGELARCSLLELCLFLVI